MENQSSPAPPPLSSSAPPPPLPPLQLPPTSSQPPSSPSLPLQPPPSSSQPPSSAPPLQPPPALSPPRNAARDLLPQTQSNLRVPTVDQESLPPTTISFSPHSPTRSLLLSQVPRNLNEQILRHDLGVFGDVRGIDVDRLISESIVIVHFFDLRSSDMALRAIRDQYQRLRTYEQLFLDDPSRSAQAAHNSPFFKRDSDTDRFVPTNLIGDNTSAGLVGNSLIWARFVSPIILNFHDDYFESTLVIFNLPSTIEDGYLAEEFATFGPIEGITHNFRKPEERFIEFYDIRHASIALAHMNETIISGRRIRINYGNPYSGHFLVEDESPDLSPFQISDRRSTILIYNIHISFGPSRLLPWLDKHCRRCNSAYDFFSLAFTSGNYGSECIINFTSPEAAWRFHREHHFKQQVFSGDRLCRVIYAPLQGVEALQTHFSSSSFPSEVAVMFFPPQDGRHPSQVECVTPICWWWWY